MLILLLTPLIPTNNPKLVFSFSFQKDQLLVFSSATTITRLRLRRRRLSSSASVVVEATGRRSNSNPWSDLKGVSADDQDKQEEEEEEDISRGGKRGRSWWWSDALLDEEDDDDEEEEDYVDDDDNNFMFSGEESEPDVWWKNIWFLKVLSSYGWFLPPIIISMLVATGPKAFLMAMAFPLGQSVISYAIDKYWLKARAGPKPRKSKTARKGNFRTSPAAGNYGRTSWKTRNGAVGEKNDDRPRRRTTSSEVRTTAGRRFGGWEELVDDDDERPPSSSYPRTANNNPSPAAGASGSILPQKKAKRAVVRRGRNRDTPLLIRLLVAIFPFLGSWVKIL